MIRFDETPVIVLGCRSAEIVAAMEAAGMTQTGLAEALDHQWTQARISQFLSQDYLGDEPCEVRFLQALKRLEL